MHLGDKIKEAGATGYILLWLSGFRFQFCLLSFCCGICSAAFVRELKRDLLMAAIDLCLAQLQNLGRKNADLHGSAPDNLAEVALILIKVI